MSIDSTVKSVQYPATSTAKHISDVARRASARVWEARTTTKTDPLCDNLSAKRDAAQFPALAEIRAVAVMSNPNSTAARIAANFCIHNKLYPIKITDNGDNSRQSRAARMSRLGYTVDRRGRCQKCEPR